MRIFDRRCRVTVDGFAVEGLRVGFTVTKDLTHKPNQAEVVIYNLARATRQRMHTGRSVPVVIEAGYRSTGDLIVIFVGHMREAFSRPEKDGSWATILRAGDGDKGLRKGRKTTGTRPGVSLDRVVKDTFGQLQVGAGNMWQAIKGGKGLGDILASGFAGVGAAADQFTTIMESAGLEWSVQDGEMQVLPAGQVLATSATRLGPDTGLEGAPEIDAKGTLTCRARIVPGLSPGYPIEIAAQNRVTMETGWYAFDIDPTTLYRIEKTRYVGDTHGDDWTAEITAIDPRVAAANAARAAAKAKKAAVPTPPAVTP